MLVLTTFLLCCYAMFCFVPGICAIFSSKWPFDSCSTLFHISVLLPAQAAGLLTQPRKKTDFSWLLPLYWFSVCWKGSFTINAVSICILLETKVLLPKICTGRSVLRRRKKHPEMQIHLPPLSASRIPTHFLSTSIVSGGNERNESLFISMIFLIWLDSASVFWILSPRGLYHVANLILVSRHW